MVNDDDEHDSMRLESTSGDDNSMLTICTLTSRANVNSIVSTTTLSSIVHFYRRPSCLRLGFTLISSGCAGKSPDEQRDENAYHWNNHADSDRVSFAESTSISTVTTAAAGAGGTARGAPRCRRLYRRRACQTRARHARGALRPTPRPIPIPLIHKPVRRPNTRRLESITQIDQRVSADIQDLAPVGPIDSLCRSRKERHAGTETVVCLLRFGRGGVAEVAECRDVGGQWSACTGGVGAEDEVG